MKDNLEQDSSSLKRKQTSTQTDAPHKKSFKINREIRFFHDKVQLKKFMTTKPVLQKVQMEILERENKDNKQKDINKTSHRHGKLLNEREI